MFASCQLHLESEPPPSSSTEAAHGGSSAALGDRHVRLPCSPEASRFTRPQTYLSCLVSWAALRSSWMFLVICSVLQMTSSVHGSVASSSAPSPGSAPSEAGRGLPGRTEYKGAVCFANNPSEPHHCPCVTDFAAGLFHQTRARVIDRQLESILYIYSRRLSHEDLAEDYL